MIEFHVETHFHVIVFHAYREKVNSKLIIFGVYSHDEATGGTLLCFWIWDFDEYCVYLIHHLPGKNMVTVSFQLTNFPNDIIIIRENRYWISLSMVLFIINCHLLEVMNIYRWRDKPLFRLLATKYDDVKCVYTLIYWMTIIYICKVWRKAVTFLTYMVWNFKWLKYPAIYLYYRATLVNTLRPRQDGRHFPDNISYAVSWMRKNDIRLKFHWSLFLRFQLTIFQHWFR